MCRNSTHNVLNETQSDKSDELKSIDKSSTTVEQNGNQEDASYTEAFAINIKAFKEEETVHHNLEACKDSTELL